MGKCLKLCALILGSALVFGCASQKNGRTPAAETASYRHSQETALQENDPASGRLLVKTAKSVIGTPYVMGGERPGGFDCSGLVKWAYNNMGVALPRTAREQSVVGQKVKNVKDMRAGDIVAFRHPKRGYHTGIYVGDGKFVHSPRKRSHVRINSLSDPYFKSTLLGARRVSLDGSEDLLAQAESRLRKLVAEKSHLALSAKNLEKIKASSKKQHAGKNSKKTVASKGKDKKIVANRNANNKKSVIAHRASKIKSIHQVTGKSKTASKNGEAHAKLATASKKTSAHKTVSMLQTKKQTKSHTRTRGRS